MIFNFDALGLCTLTNSICVLFVVQQTRYVKYWHFIEIHNRTPIRTAINKDQTNDWSLEGI